jgi:hypothetical protein
MSPGSSVGRHPGRCCGSTLEAGASIPAEDMATTGTFKPRPMASAIARTGTPASPFIAAGLGRCDEGPRRARTGRVRPQGWLVP